MLYLLGVQLTRKIGLSLRKSYMVTLSVLKVETRDGVKQIQQTPLTLQTREKITEGDSALFLPTSGAALSKECGAEAAAIAQT